MGLAFAVMPVIALLVVSFAGSPTLGAVVGGRQLATVLLGCLGALMIGQEFRFGTIRTTLASVPQRSRVLIAKLITIAVITTVVMIVGMASSLAIGLLSREGRELWDLSSSQLWQGLAVSVVMSLVYAVVGFSLATLFRTPIGAIVALLVWPLLAEPIIFAIAQIRDWQPFISGFDWTQVDSAPDVRWFKGPLVLAAVVVVIVAAAWQQFHQRDA
jgi:ABC-2 type transport system permease protein